MSTYQKSMLICQIFLLYLNMIFLYNATSDWYRESRDSANKTSCLPAKKYLVSPFRKSRIFSFRRYKKAKIIIRCWQKYLMFEFSLNHKNFFYFTFFIRIYERKKTIKKSQTIKTFDKSKNYKKIKNWHILYNHTCMLFGFLLEKNFYKKTFIE